MFSDKSHRSSPELSKDQGFSASPAFTLQDRTSQVIKAALHENDFETAIVEAIKFHHGFRSQMGHSHFLEIPELATLMRRSILDKNFSAAALAADYWCSVIEPEINPAPFETVQMHFFCALAFQGSGGSQRAAISFYHVVCASDFSGPLERGYAAEALIRLADLLVTSRDSEVLGQALARLRGETSDTRALAAYYYTWGKALAEENREDLDELAEEASLGLERIRWGH